jgi:DNA-directed RNA polymerase subunit RPC12/RpoP
MTAMFPLLYCSKCGSRMLVGFVQAASGANDVTYACAPCGTMETITVPAPGGISYMPSMEHSVSIGLSSRRSRQF